MLQNLRESSQGIIAKVIVGFIIVTFALWGVDSLVGLATGSGAPITVNGVEISEQQIAQETELQRRQLVAQLGDQLDPAQLEDSVLRPQVIERLIEQTLLVNTAQERGQAVSNSYLDQAIIATPAFQVDGAFNRDQFEARLRSAGLTPQSYRQLLRRDALMVQEESAIKSTAFVLPADLERIQLLDRQTRDLRYVIFSAGQELSSIEVSDAEISGYYSEHKGEFVTEEQVKLSYISLKQKDLAQGMEVSDEDLQEAYQTMLDGFQADEARTAAHILVAIDETRDAAAALARAEEIKARLSAGEDFSSLAREFSDDPGSAEYGGDLGVVEKGVMVAEFEQVLFAQAEGVVSEPVKTEFGYHLIKTVNIDRAEPPSLQETRAGLLEELRAQKAASAFVGKMEQLADISFAAADLKEPAQVLGLDIHETDSFGRSGGSSALTSFPRVIDAAFSAELLSEGLNSQVIEIGSEEAVVVRVKQHLPSRQLAEDEVYDRIIAQLRQHKATEKALAKAQQALDSSQQSLSAEVGWQKAEGLRRNNTAVPAEIVEALFKMPKPQGDAPSLQSLQMANGDVAVLALTHIGLVDDQLGDQERNAIKSFLAVRGGQAEYQALIRNLRSRAEVERL